MEAETLHVCFLVHGHRGFARDLSYLQQKMQQMAAATRNSDTDMVVHAAVCNEGKTTDGVIKGGDRLTEEMLLVLRQELAKRNARHVTVSVLGNSLGGVYGRFALAKLTDSCHDSKLDGRYPLHFNIFCTTATPHLGIASHTFFPIPRRAEIGVAHAMGETGKDLFRLNDLLKSMATEERYLNPLAKFRKRIAYANAFGTDFPVPVHTAAFLNEDSTYPHHFLAQCEDEDQLVVDANGMVIATVHTPSREGSEHDLSEHFESDDDLTVMSTSLDALGWKKVFVDVRKEIPKITLPRLWKDMNKQERELAIQELKEKGVASSKDVAAAVTSPLFEDKFHWPMGHNMIVAFSRSPLSAYMNKGGRPLVDSLAKDLVEDIFNWNEDNLREHVNQ